MIQRLPVTQGLQALLASLTGRPVGLRSVPLDSKGAPLPPPYTLLYPLDRTDDTATLADNQRAAVLDYQATFVSGPTPGVPNSRGGDEQAQWLADRGWKVVERPADGSPGYTNALSVGPGVHCWRREAREAGGTSDQNDAIITSVIRYRLFLEEQPAG
ncbi:hypothetical protein [Streptomyces violaceorubidus]|uniref:hypothetical protein n=1 Tax=Streptomyces violaceorubidus TaxID=284042 RepID=UPI0004C20033|nr:hypothetical protein [Streptomyces violaceorubidus]